MYKCEKCVKNFTTKAAKTNHEKSCGLVKIKEPKLMFVCNSCGFEIFTCIEKHINSCDGKGPRRRRDAKYRGIYGGWQKDKTFDELFGKEKSEEIKNKMSLGNKGNPGIAATEEGELQRKNKIRDSINTRYELGWNPVCGRAKKYEYESKSAGKIKVDGTWELKVAKYLDDMNLDWRRPAERFNYINLEGKKSKYKPDFYVNDYSAYLEIKGYETELDRCKWSQFKENLIIWRKNDLIRLNILEDKPRRR
jgi:hypothetical protein